MTVAVMLCGAGIALAGIGGGWILRLSVERRRAEALLDLCKRWEAYWDHPMRDPAARVAVCGLVTKIRERLDG